jgi:hypothetical protein
VTLDSRGALRAAVALVEKELLVENGSLALRGEWRHLVETLALTPAPALEPLVAVPPGA